MIRVMVKSNFDGRHVVFDAHNESEAADWLWRTCKLIQNDNPRSSFPANVEINEWSITRT